MLDKTIYKVQVKFLTRRRQQPVLPDICNQSGSSNYYNEYRRYRNDYNRHMNKNS